MTPVFLISLPRSGSTVLQRAIAAHPSVHTAPEPWLLLGLLLWDSPIETDSEVGFRTLRHALGQFLTTSRRSALEHGIRETTLATYSAEAPATATYFLDKTPRYALILPQILRLFPDAYYILLTRAPLDIVESIVSTWGDRGRRWRVRPYYPDLHAGFRNIAQTLLTPPQRLLHLRYEDLVADPASTLRRVSAFLDLHEESLTGSLAGGDLIAADLGDRKGRASGAIEGDRGALDAVTLNGLRRRWCCRFLRSLTPEYMSATGYDFAYEYSRVSHDRRQSQVIRDIGECTLQFAKVALPLRRIRAWGIRHVIQQAPELH